MNKEMTNNERKLNAEPPRVLIFSQRNIYETEAWRGIILEFENTVQKIDSVELLATRPQRWFKKRFNNAMRVMKRGGIAINSGVPKVKLNKHYDLFLAVIEKPSELLHVNSLLNLKDHCKVSICWVTEFWLNQMHVYGNFLKLLKKFDYIFVNFYNSVEAIERKINRECFYLPTGVDAIRFCPDFKPLNKTIDIYSIGRRSEKVHSALLNIMAKTGRLYIYDTFSNLTTYSVEQHRNLISNLMKRSRYFIVNPGKFNQNVERGTQDEIGSRYFEGAAAGTIMLGKPVNNEKFKELFSWEGSVIKLPSDMSKLEQFISEIDMQPELQLKVMKNNVINSLLHNDWVYRYETMLKFANIEPLQMLIERKEQLTKLCEKIAVAKIEDIFCC